MPEADYRPQPDLTPAERGAERRRRQPLIHERLTRWGEWQRTGGVRLATSAASIEARLMRTAPGGVSAALPAAWVCGHCQARAVAAVRPRSCEKCMRIGSMYRPDAHRATESRSARPSEIAGDPDAELIDRAVAAMGLARPRLKTVVMLVYLRGYSVNLVADYLRCAWYQARAWIEAAQCWIEGWLTAREVRQSDQPGANPKQRPRRG